MSTNNHKSPQEITNLLMDTLISIVATGNHNSTLGNFFGLSHLPDDDIAALKALTKEGTEESRRRLRKSAHSIISIRLNRKNISAACSIISDDLAKNKLIGDLIRRQAPYPMMFEYFGLNINEVSGLRKRLGVKISGGRPSELSQSEMEKTYASYKIHQSRYSPDVEPYREARLCKAIYDDTLNISMAKIYSFVSEMKNDA